MKLYWQDTTKKWQPNWVANRSSLRFGRLPVLPGLSWTAVEVYCVLYESSEIF